MILSQKLEVFPDFKQKEQLERMFGMRRFCFNKGLHELKKVFGKSLSDKVEDKKLNKTFIMKMRREVFRDHFAKLIKTIPFHVMDNALEDLFKAVQSLKSKNKWKKGKKQEKNNLNRVRKGKSPHLNTVYFRKKKYSNSCRIHKSGNGFSNKGKSLRIPRLGWLNTTEELRWKNVDIKLVTLSKKSW